MLPTSHKLAVQRCALHLGFDFFTPDPVLHLAGLWLTGHLVQVVARLNDLVAALDVQGHDNCRRPGSIGDRICIGNTVARNRSRARAARFFVDPHLILNPRARVGHRLAIGTNDPLGVVDFELRSRTGLAADPVGIRGPTRHDTLVDA